MCQSRIEINEEKTANIHGHWLAPVPRKGAVMKQKITEPRDQVLLFVYNHVIFK